MYDRKEHGEQVIRFGDWMVTTRGIVWASEGGPEYFLAKVRLWETRPSTDGGTWDWLVHLPEKTWLSEADVYCLNTAFFFAQDYHRSAKPAGATDASTWRTLQAQQEEMTMR